MDAASGSGFPLVGKVQHSTAATRFQDLVEAGEVESPLPQCHCGVLATRRSPQNSAARLAHPTGIEPASLP